MTKNAPSLISFYQLYYAEASDGGYLSQVLSLWDAPARAPIFHAWGAALRQVNDTLGSDIRDIVSQVG